MIIGFLQPWFLLLSLTALIPWFIASQQPIAYSSLAVMPRDALSTLVDYLLRFSGAAAALCLSLGMAGPYLAEQWVERVGNGAHIVLLLDRSSSMSENFSGRYLGGAASESKSAVARKLLGEFVERREHDSFAMVSFAAAPIFVLPLTQDREAVLAAIRAIADRGNGITNIAPGLAMALDFFDGQPVSGSRIILLVSDGAARIEDTTREEIRQRFHDSQSSLYWIYLRNPKSSHLSDKPANPDESTTPEYFLHQYFQGMGVPYRAFEADNPEAVQRAIAEVERQGNLPLRYLEKQPRQDISAPCYGAALAFLLLVLLGKAVEVRTWNG